jgi:hypothetical protein
LPVVVEVLVDPVVVEVLVDTELPVISVLL